ncbi:MAG: 4'-phosphopantetheinyl transferase superfamily protein [Muribaculaceae bacterium]|nr:4'-phosphopantetheinyl transferase superfamily protein [Muribaculaceae bacterium]
MDERFPDEFVTWHHKTFVGIKVDEVFGMDSKNGQVWTELARQIFCEQGENYKVIDHFENGAPYLEGYPGRISLTHTTHFFAVATLPKTPEVNLDSFNPRASMGIDAESLERTQVLKVRNKFLSDKELELVPEENIKANIIAWTSKEALYKAALTPGMDFRENIRITKLPELQNDPVKAKAVCLGEAEILFPEETGNGIQAMNLFSYESYGCCVTIAFSPKCAKFGK